MTEPQNTKWLSYQQASEWAQSQNIMTCDQWNERCAVGLPEGVPADPQTVYGDEFVGWYEFLGVQLSRDGRKVFGSSNNLNTMGYIIVTIFHCVYLLLKNSSHVINPWCSV